MMDWLLGLVSICVSLAALTAFFINGYVAVSMINEKQLGSAGNCLLLHMGVLNTVASLLTLLALALGPEEHVEGHVLCVGQGLAHMAVHPVALLNVAGMHVDRFISIAYPLRYTSIVSAGRIKIFLFLIWLPVVLLLTLLIVFSIPFRALAPSHVTLCLPDPSHLPSFLVISALVLLILAPAIVIIGVNARIVCIARRHRYSIANALIAFAPQQTLTKKALVRKQQNEALGGFEGVDGTAIMTQLFFSLILLYAPFLTLIVVQTITNIHLSEQLCVLAYCLLALSPLVNGVVYGLRSKEMEKLLVRFARKEISRNEVQQEIRLRSPTNHAALSTKPSMANLLVGQIYGRNHLQSRLSEANLNHINRASSLSMLSQRLSSPLPNSSLSRARHQPGTLSHTLNGRHAHHVTHPIRRHASDLMWRLPASNSMELEVSRPAVMFVGDNSDDDSSTDDKSSLDKIDECSVSVYDEALCLGTEQMLADVDVHENQLYDTNKTAFDGTTKKSSGKSIFSGNYTNNVVEEHNFLGNTRRGNGAIPHRFRAHTTTSHTNLSRRFNSSAVMNGKNEILQTRCRSTSDLPGALNSSKSINSTVSIRNLVSFSNLLRDKWKRRVAHVWSRVGSTRSCAPRITITRAPTLEQETLLPSLSSSLAMTTKKKGVRVRGFQMSSSLSSVVVVDEQRRQRLIRHATLAVL